MSSLHEPPRHQACPDRSPRDTKKPSLPSCLGDESYALTEWLAEAWAVRRQHFPDVLHLPAPGVKHYEVEGYRNDRSRFLHVSITGAACALACAHCQGQLLQTMVPATTPPELLRLGRELHTRGGEGLLVSGGADERGRVPLLPYGEVLAQLADLGLRVIVHCGLPDRATVRTLKDAGVEQVLLDVVGDAETCRAVLGLDRTPADYRAALELLHAEGLSVAPHIVAGLHGGRMRGECEALEMVAQVGVQRLVIVVFTPRTGTPLAQRQPPAVEEVARLLAAARLRLPTTPLSLGCMRPAGAYKTALDGLAVRAGVNAIAFPAEAVPAAAASLGLDCVYGSLCCCLDERAQFTLGASCSGDCLPVAAHPPAPPSTRALRALREGGFLRESRSFRGRQAPAKNPA